jgi:hypothetical protein
MIIDNLTDLCEHHWAYVYADMFTVEDVAKI